MSRELLARLARRAVVLGATLGVLAVAAYTINVAAEWRAASAPLDVPQVSMDSIDADLAAEVDRTGVLSDEIVSLHEQVAALQAALGDADDRVSGDVQHADDLAASLEATRAKLASLEDQLAAARDRLAALKKAAARQAAINAAAKRSTTSASHEDEHEHEDEPEHDD